ncbi:uncharacterized protein LOC143301719 isoform X2 [Babylonia areolata]|uniref:uncharacterized protein LOC143301719 isoform X2 n=1 Tax=Babylonia areolata TaxID=304850 RepID=UPI003FD04C60
MMRLLVVSLCVLVTVKVGGGQSCTSSFQCTAGQCCRSLVNNATLVSDNYPWGGLGSLQTGQCFAGHAGPGERCDSGCRCQPGYSCYRPPTGVCCAPSTCIPLCEAIRNRLRDNCSPPPPVVNPGSGGVGAVPQGLSADPARHSRRRRRPSLFYNSPACQCLLTSGLLDTMCSGQF